MVATEDTYAEVACRDRRVHVLEGERSIVALAGAVPETLACVQRRHQRVRVHYPLISMRGD